jgi:hypothetical protein
MSIPRYKFDPVTQRYTLLTPQEEQQKAQQEGGLRAMGGGGGDPSPADPSDFASLSGPEQAAFYAENPMFSNITQAMQTGLSMTSGGRAISALQDIAEPGVPGGKTSFTTQQHSIAQGINPDLASPVAPGPMTVTPITPNPAFSDLAAMNAAVTESVSRAQTQQAADQAAAEAVEAASALAMSPGVGVATSEAAPAAAPAADSSGGGGGFDNLEVM